jgi:hypothetical protein
MPKMETSALARQVGGDHYKQLTPQPVEVAWAWELPFAEGSVLKYLYRWHVKKDREDLEKLHHWVEMIMEHDIEAETERCVHCGSSSECWKPAHRTAT